MCFGSADRFVPRPCQRVAASVSRCLYSAVGLAPEVQLCCPLVGGPVRGRGARWEWAVTAVRGRSLRVRRLPARVGKAVCSSTQKAEASDSKTLANSKRIAHSLHTRPNALIRTDYYCAAACSQSLQVRALPKPLCKRCTTERAAAKRGVDAKQEWTHSSHLCKPCKRSPKPQQTPSTSSAPNGRTKTTKTIAPDDYAPPKTSAPIFGAWPILPGAPTIPTCARRRRNGRARSGRATTTPTTLAAVAAAARAARAAAAAARAARQGPRQGPGPRRQGRPRPRR